MEPSLIAYPAQGRLGLAQAAALDGALARKLALESVLHGHAGCVNRLAWSEGGELLASASDDLRVMLWHAADSGRVPIALETQHRMNLFGVQFLPGWGNRKIVTGAMDSTVQLLELDASPSAAPPAWRSSSGGGGNAPRRHPAAGVARVESAAPRVTVFSCHDNRVKDVKVAPGEPHLFWSASEDGTVRQFDTRLPGQKSPSSPNVLLRVAPPGGSGSASAGGGGGGGGGGGPRPARRVEVKGLDICPTAPHLLALACGDPFVRVFDRRRLGPGAPAAVAASEELLKLAPPHLPIALYGRRSSRAHSTCVSFSSRGDRLVATYHSDHAYCFDVTGAGAARGAYYRPPAAAAPVEAGRPAPAAPARQGGGGGGGSGGGGGGGGGWERQLPMGAELAKLQGNAALFESSHAEAVEAFTRAIWLAPWAPGLYAQRALALLRRRWEGDDAAALADCDAAQRLAAAGVDAGGAAADGVARQAAARRVQALRALGQFACAAAACADYERRWPVDSRSDDYARLADSVARALEERRRRLKAQRAELRRLRELRRGQAAKRARGGGGGGGEGGEGGAEAAAGSGGEAPVAEGFVGPRLPSPLVPPLPPPPPPPPPPVAGADAASSSGQQVAAQQQQQQQPAGEEQQQQAAGQQTETGAEAEVQHPAARPRRGPEAFEVGTPSSRGEEGSEGEGTEEDEEGEEEEEEDEGEGEDGSSSGDGEGGSEEAGPPAAARRRLGAAASDSGSDGDGRGSGSEGLSSDAEADWEVEALLPWYGAERYGGGADGAASGSGGGSESDSSSGGDGDGGRGARRRRGDGRRAAAACWRARVAAALCADPPPPPRRRGANGGGGPGGYWDATPGGRRMLARCIGHSNVQTDIKEAVFLGRGDGLIACGSDDGRVFIYDADSGAPIKALEADDDVANCCRCHPDRLLLATSGIQHTIKLWSPTGPAEHDDDRLSSLVAANQRAMRGGAGMRLLRGLQPGVLQAALDEHPELLQMLLRGMHAHAHAAAPAPAPAGGEGRGGGGDDDEEDAPHDAACRVA
ncbi:hypothetical protein Rsub_08137 [Raphidocelis subcapitata]|uniref:Uncharacterized protein n=1 Tax=Raphidocelis subcapitata TaxID=307507 RepID=A0A2V0P4V2_9CHLO|nr:hypothetical protein Rsub_08137 [Raphidocelis subcapitata]|eukprot:GBF94894.1 hypothetical protein Rsub_08137 [Raphidocelis subcapitata]